MDKMPFISTGSTPAQLEEAEVGRRHAPGRTAEKKKAAVSARRFRTELILTYAAPIMNFSSRIHIMQQCHFTIRSLSC
jgi:hypothetical protein